MFCDVGIPGAYLVKSEAHSDKRGSFTRYFDRELFAARGLAANFDQDGVVRNSQAGTLRGLHYQRAPHAETKLIVCLTGAVFDVLVDLRSGPGYGRHAVVELSADVPQSLYVPAGCAHGYQTLTNDSTLFYRIGSRYVPQSASGIRWDDPSLGIAWPLAVTELSQRDALLPTLDATEFAMSHQ